MSIKLVYFISPGNRCPEKVELEGVTLSCYTDYTAYPIEMSRSVAFVIALAEQDEAIRVLRSLRQNPQTGLQPIFTTLQLGSPNDLMSDGVINTPVEAFTQSRDIIERLQQLDSTIFELDTSDFFRILGYMFSRPAAPLNPQRSWSHGSFYTYPALEAILGSMELITSRLISLCDRKLLQRGQLIDRIRHCPECNGVHLNFIDTCPNCKHINIVQQPFLHCFTCGKVAPEERFTELGVLQCPNCRTRLRHIGADYDRPLENYECLSCHHVFIEPEVQAHCMHCGTPSSPDQLTPQLVYSYELTDMGIRAVKSGTMEDVFALLDTVNNVSPTYFMNLVSWLMEISRRHTEERFSIIGIKLKNILELDTQFGKQVVAELMDTLAMRLRELVRSTDLATRTGQQMFWILLPKTGKPNHLVVLNRILELKNLAQHIEGRGLDFETIAFHAPEDLTPGETGKLLLSRLEEELG